MTAPRHQFLIVVCGMIAIALVSLAGTPTTQSSAATEPSAPIEVNLKEMSLFHFDQQTGVLADIPQRFRDLEGKRVTFVGEMWNPAVRDHDHVSSFEAVYSKTKWSFSGPPLAQNFWDCAALPDVKIFYYDSPVKVTGIFHVKIKKEDGYIRSIYQVDVESLQPFDGDFPSTTQKSAATEPGEPIEVNLKEMSLFRFDPQTGVVTDIPRRYRDLEGKRVTFVCEMWAPVGTNEQGLTFFQAVYSKQKWSFRGAPHPQDFWDCLPSPGVKISYYDSPVKIVGVFHIKIQKNKDGFINSTYRINVESLEPFDGNFPPPVHATTRPDL